MKNKLGFFFGLAVAVVLVNGIFVSAGDLVVHPRTQILKPDANGYSRWEVIEGERTLKAEETAIIVCDVWDKHWARGATERVSELAPRMNKVLKAARARGITIIHAPADVIKYYEGTPARRRMMDAPQAVLPKEQPHENPPDAVDSSDGGSDTGEKPWALVWRRQHPAIEIDQEKDGISENIQEIWNFMQQRRIKHVIIMGVHTNMCILNRPYGIRAMVRRGADIMLARDLTDAGYNPGRPPYVSHEDGTRLCIEYIEKFWCPSIASKDLMKTDSPTDSQEVARRLDQWLDPASDHRYQTYVEEKPDADYQHASEEAIESFHDWKYGIRLHWGLYTFFGRGGESWILTRERSTSNADRQRYQELYKKWNPKDFDADRWMRLFADCGIRCMAFTTKHHDGFSMYDTKTRVKNRINWGAAGGPAMENCDLAYSIMETPFRRDVVKELCESAHRHGIKIDLYFSNGDWYNADFRPYYYHPLQTPSVGKWVSEYIHRVHPENIRSGFPCIRVADPTPEERARAAQHYHDQLMEIVSQYGKIDMVCLDSPMGPGLWPTMKETIKEIRRKDPDVMFRNRGIGCYGDYHTPEGYVPGGKEKSTMPWMVIYPLGGSFSYINNDNYKGAGWIVKNLVDVVSKGGNFMPAIGPDADGRFDPEAIRQLKAAGDWLKVNGEAIYATRPREGNLWKEGADIRFTRSKDNKTVYALCLKWPGKTLTLNSVRPREGSKITMLGVAEPLDWHMTDQGLRIELPAKLQDEANRPCKYCYTLKIEGLAAP